MNRKLKALGAALLAAMAVGAVAVGSASGTSGGHFVSDGESTTLDITEAENHVFTASGIAIECTHSTFSAKDVSETETSITVTPIYTDCWLGEHDVEGNEVEVDMGSCDYEFTVGTFAEAWTHVENEEETYTHNTVDVVCPDEDEITVKTKILGNCTLHIPEQVVEGISYTNKDDGGFHDVTVDITAEGITYTRTSEGLFGCKNLLGSHGTDGKYSGDATVTGTNAEGKGTDITAIGSDELGG